MPLTMGKQKIRTCVQQSDSHSAETINQNRVLRGKRWFRSRKSFLLQILIWLLNTSVLLPSFLQHIASCKDNWSLRNKYLVSKPFYNLWHRVRAWVNSIILCHLKSFWKGISHQHHRPCTMSKERLYISSGSPLVSSSGIPSMFFLNYPTCWEKFNSLPH